MRIFKGNNSEALVFAQKAFTLCTEESVKPDLNRYILDIKGHTN